MIDTVVYILGYDPSFTLTPDMEAAFKATNPLTRSYVGKHGYTLYWPDTEGQSTSTLNWDKPFRPQNRYHPVTGELYSQCVVAPYDGVPLGRITFYDRYCYVLSHTHNGHILSISEAKDEEGRNE